MNDKGKGGEAIMRMEHDFLGEMEIPDGIMVYRP